MAWDSGVQGFGGWEAAYRSTLVDVFGLDVMSAKAVGLGFRV